MNRPRRYLRALPLLLATPVLIALLTLPHLSILPRTAPLLRPHQPRSAVHPINPPESCHLLHVDPLAHDLWHFSSRSLCLSPPLCIHLASASLHVSPHSDRHPDAPVCHIHASGLPSDSDPSDPPPDSDAPTFPALLNASRHNCTSFRHRFVRCAHGRLLHRATPFCPTITDLPLPPADHDSPSTNPTNPTHSTASLWLSDVTIVVPDYAFPRNIYHFLSPLLDIAHVLSHLHPLLARHAPWPRAPSPTRVTVLFRQSRDLLHEHRWKAELLPLVLRSHTPPSVSLRVAFLPQLPPRLLCLRRPVMLGRRGHFNAWPFTNRTAVSPDGHAAPLASILFRRSIYLAANLSTVLPTESAARNRSAWAAAPPLVIAYARRAGVRGRDGYFQAGAMRRFTAQDEVWLHAMLQAEASRAGAELQIIDQNRTQGLAEQARAMERAGLVVGIHGANLVNAVFVRPFGALVEVFPHGVTERCYFAGANAGLWYRRFEAGLLAGAVESGCYFRDAWCQRDLRQRMVKFADGDREKLRALVRDGLQYLRSLHARFGDSIPIAFENAERTFVVDESRANPS